MTQPAIVAEDLTYHYGDNIAVDHISFEVAAGEVLGFLGPNGAGKSTTVKMLTGQLRPKSGRALLLGSDVSRQTGQVQAHIGVCFERNNLYERMSGIENLRLFANLFGISGFDPMPLLEKVGLSERGKDRVEGYSKGMKQRLMIARALVNDPQILFLDEPTDGLDPVSAEAIRRLVLEQREQGKTIFLTTHDMMEADKLSDRVGFITDGKIVALDTPRALKQQYGKRALKVEVSDGNGGVNAREIDLDQRDTSSVLQTLFEQEQVVTVHSEEATLEDIFIRITGQELVI